MHTMRKLRLVIIAFFVCAVINIVYDFFASTASQSDDETQTCNNNFFTGSWRWINAIDWLITRYIAGLSAQTLNLYIFYKQNISTFTSSNKFKSRAYNDSVAESMFYEWQTQNSEINITPGAQHEDDEDMLKVKNMSRSEREFRESLADPMVQSSLAALNRHQNPTQFKLHRQSTEQRNLEEFDQEIEGRKTLKHTTNTYEEESHESSIYSKSDASSRYERINETLDGSRYKIGRAHV